ncbi:hypothetical protein FKP32DRAFT_1541800, partial [Trametes sanguinea]
EGHPSAYSMIPFACVVSAFAPALGVAVRAKAMAEVGLTSVEALKIAWAGVGLIAGVVGCFAALLFTA